MGNKVITTVCDVLVRDPSTHAAMYRGTTNSTTAFTLAMKNSEVRGGRNNPLIMKYMHGRDLGVTIDTVTTDEQILAMNLGNSVTNGQYNVLTTDCLTLDASGVGTLQNIPTANVDVALTDGTLVTVVPVISGETATITVVAAANQKVNASYVCSKTVDRVAVGTTTPPSVVELYMTGEVRDSATNAIVQYMQFWIPAFQIDGNYKLNFKADGTSTESLTGSALSVAGVDCASGDTYGYVYWIPNTSASYTYTGIACSPNAWSTVHGVAATQQINVLALRGTAYPATNVTSACTFAASGATGVTVSSSGLVTAAGTTSAGTATVTATFNPSGTAYTDTFTVTLT